MSSACYYQWRSKFGGMDASLIKRMKELAIPISVSPLNVARKTMTVHFPKLANITLSK